MKRNTIEFICGNILRQLRVNAGYTSLKALSIDTGIPVAKLSKIETGRQCLDMLTLIKFCMVLDFNMGAVVQRMQDVIVDIYPPPFFSIKK